MEECRALKEVLAMYQKAYGQAVNYVKSAITFSKSIPQTDQNILMETIGITKLGGFGRYLGLHEKLIRRRNMLLNTLDIELRIKWIAGTIIFSLKQAKKCC